MNRFVMLAIAAGAMTCGAVVAEEDPNLPNPLRNENLIATCSNLSAQIRAADPQVMAALSGVWEGQGMIPGVAGLYPDTPQQIRTQNNPDGTFTIDYYACFQPYGQQQSCAQSFRYGEWTAHMGADGWIAVPFISGGSSFTGQALPVSCAINFVQLRDAGTMVDQGGGVMYRVQ